MFGNISINRISKFLIKMVAECFVYWWRKIVKFFGNIKIIYVSMSNEFNVEFINIEILRNRALRKTKCGETSFFEEDENRTFDE